MKINQPNCWHSKKLLVILRLHSKLADDNINIYSYRWSLTTHIVTFLPEKIQVCWKCNTTHAHFPHFC
ncbi:unnamed protein product [Cuscuta campestris]|uniref:Uncharacterized protein n=1 Tax=Cuscuta campestris TaxID=132261 RepID=A0A484KUG9_9ASTE|nr:unnamed protein product [Cuscuta campestris]